MQKYLFISPHLDDVVLSCGGIVHNLSLEGFSVKILTIFSGDPANHQPLSSFAQTLHNRWNLPQNAVTYRRAEDKKAIHVLGAESAYLNYLDCIYRYTQDELPLISQEEDLYMEIPENEFSFTDEIQQKIKSEIDENTLLVTPLAIGGHLDHRITRMVIEKFSNPIYYYADYPYITRQNSEVSSFIDPEWKKIQFTLSNEDLMAWVSAIGEYHSQLSTFWADKQTMQDEILNYYNAGGGKNLWLGQ